MGLETGQRRSKKNQREGQAGRKSDREFREKTGRGHGAREARQRPSGSLLLLSLEVQVQRDLNGSECPCSSMRRR